MPQPPAAEPAPTARTAPAALRVVAPFESAGGGICPPAEPDSIAAAAWLRRAVALDELNLPLPGVGSTLQRFHILAALGAADPVRARLGEGHADAVAIRAELGATAQPGASGVWAASPTSLQAECGALGWTLSGQRPWCSGAWACSHALVTAQAPDGIRLFEVDTSAHGLRAVEGSWPAVGMAASDTRTLRFDDVPAIAVGGPGEYVARPGFWHGAIGVAACWYGGAVGVARQLLRRVHSDEQGDPHRLAHLGGVEASLGAAADSLRAAAELIDAEPRRPLPREAARVRAVVEDAATDVLARVGRACGAGPLGHDRAHSRQVADLTVYLRQSHAEADLAALGAQVAEAGDPDVMWDLGPGR